MMEEDLNRLDAGEIWAGAAENGVVVEELVPLQPASLISLSRFMEALRGNFWRRTSFGCRIGTTS